MSAPGSHQGDGGSESDPSVIKIDPDGDLTLVVGKNKTRFLVCSKTLSRSAPFWKRCLYGPFKEAKPTAGQDWVVELPEDNPSGLKCLLLLAHGLGHEMPVVDLQLAFEITVLTNKYDMTRYLWAFTRPWLSHLDPTGPDHGHAVTVVPQLKWLWLTKELGDLAQHGEAFFELSQTVSASRAHLMLKLRTPKDAGFLTKDTLRGYDAEKDVILVLADQIKAARQKSLSDVYCELLGNTITLESEIARLDPSNGYRAATLCNARSSTRRGFCQYIMHGIVTKMSARKDSAKVTSMSQIFMSVDDYLASALGFISRVEEEHALILGNEHKECTPFKRKLPTRNSLKNDRLLDLKLHASQKFLKQGRLSGFMKDGDGEDDGNEDKGNSASRIASLKRSRYDFEARIAE